MNKYGCKIAVSDGEMIRIYESSLSPSPLKCFFVKGLKGELAGRDAKAILSLLADYIETQYYDLEELINVLHNAFDYCAKIAERDWS